MAADCAYLGLVPVHPAPGRVPEVVEEGVVLSPPGEGAGAVEARAHEHRVGQRGHQLVTVEAAVGGHLQHILLERATKEGSRRFSKWPYARAFSLLDTLLIRRLIMVSRLQCKDHILWATQGIFGKGSHKE